MTLRPTLTGSTRAPTRSWASSEGVRRSMRSNRRTDTTPERLVRSALHRRGLRFRKDYRIYAPPLRVRADIAFPRRRVAVFVDGCFWHRCPEHATDPKINGAFWERKLRANVERDQAVDRALTTAGWRVIRSWEHERPDTAAARIVAELFELAAEVAQIEEIGGDR